MLSAANINAVCNPPCNIRAIPPLNNTPFPFSWYANLYHFMISDGDLVCWIIGNNLSSGNVMIDDITPDTNPM